MQWESTRSTANGRGRSRVSGTQGRKQQWIISLRQCGTRQSGKWGHWRRDPSCASGYEQGTARPGIAFVSIVFGALLGHTVSHRVRCGLEPFRGARDIRRREGRIPISIRQDEVLANAVPLAGKSHGIHLGTSLTRGDTDRAHDKGRKRA